MEKRICDLHTHSIFSDGTDTPERVVDLAVEAGLSAVALTDHNTVSGLERFTEYAADKPIDIVPGIEFSTEHNGQELHILGLFVQPTSYRAITDYTKIDDERKEASNIDLAQKLNDNGYLVDYQAIKSTTPDGKVNRALFATALVESGYFSTNDDAFATVLSEKHGWYVRPERISSLETIEFIRSIGAVPVWAHPLFHVDYETCEAFLPIAKAHGLIGIETEYSLYSEADTAFSKEMCRKFGMLESGGSDYHGRRKRDISIGKGKGNLAIPYSFYEDLRRAAERTL